MYIAGFPKLFPVLLAKHDPPPPDPESKKPVSSTKPTQPTHKDHHEEHQECNRLIAAGRNHPARSQHRCEYAVGNALSLECCVTGLISVSLGFYIAISWLFRIKTWRPHWRSAGDESI